MMFSEVIGIYREDHSKSITLFFNGTSSGMYSVIQEENSVFLEVISVIVRGNFPWTCV